MRFLMMPFLLASISNAFSQDKIPEVDQIFLNDGSNLNGKIIFEDGQILMLIFSDTDEIITIDQKDILS